MALEKMAHVCSLSLSLLCSLKRHWIALCKESVCVLLQNMNPTDDFVYGPNDFGELSNGCRKCHVGYGSATELKLHFATTHHRQTFECFVCNKLFLQKFNFLAHIDRVHPDLGQNFSCQFCDRVCQCTDNNWCISVLIIIIIVLFCRCTQLEML